VENDFEIKASTLDVIQHKHSIEEVFVLPSGLSLLPKTAKKSQCVFLKGETSCVAVSKQSVGVFGPFWIHHCLIRGE
jgi:hypothetical protein